MKVEILKVLGKEVIIIDGVKIEVELRMIKDCWGKIVFKTWSRFYTDRTPMKILREKYSKEIRENKK